LAGYISRYIGGLPGIGLLLLRATVGVMAITQGRAFAIGHESGHLWLWLVAVVLCLAGSALILGALIVLTSLTIALAEMGTASSLLPSPLLFLPISQSGTGPRNRNDNCSDLLRAACKKDGGRTEAHLSSANTFDRLQSPSIFRSALAGILSDTPTGPCFGAAGLSSM
jgi:hypothetical protein